MLPEVARLPARWRRSRRLVHSHLLQVSDGIAETRFVVDTGAEVSVTPGSPEGRKLRAHAAPLQAANGRAINTYGERYLTLDIVLRQRFWLLFWIADMKYDILGANFQRHFGLLVDISGWCFVDCTRSFFVYGIPSSLSAHPHRLQAATEGVFPIYWLDLQNLLHRVTSMNQWSSRRRYSDYRTTRTLSS